MSQGFQYVRQAARFVCAAFLIAIASRVEARIPIPEGGTSIISADPITTANFWAGDNEGQAVGSRQTVSADHPDFDQAIRVSVTNPSGQFWNGAVQFNSTQNVSAGDILFVRVFFRSIENTEETGAGFATVFVQGPAPGFIKYLSREINGFEEWNEFLFPLTVTDSLAAGQLSCQIGFGAGTRPQVFEIGGIEMINYRQTLSIDDLPETLPTYVGREPDAAWRADANARIEAHRKGDFRIRFLDSSNNPIEVETRIAFKKHAYHFGSVIYASRIMGAGSDDAIYREKVLELFNQSGTENDLKWGAWAGEWGSNFNQEQTLAALQWLRDNGLYTRGHVMVWPSKTHLPNLIQEYLPEGDPASAEPVAKQVVLEHIDDIASKTAAYLDEWDVINEPFDNHYLMDAFGDEVMVDWFDRARSNLSGHTLYLNDYGILTSGGRDAAHQQHFEDTIQYLLDQNTPIDGLGMQGHFSASPTAIPTVFNILERFHSKFPDLDIRITEFDLKTTDEELQGDYTRDLLTIAFSHPATVGVQTWGFWAGQHYYPDAALYDVNWREKPNATAWKELIYDTWWNDFQGMSNTQGSFDFRGFHGDYEANFVVDGIEHEIEFQLSSNGPEEIAWNTDFTVPNETILSVAKTGYIHQIEVQTADTESCEVEASFDLIHWTPFLSIENPIPGIHYRKQVVSDQGEASFYRIAP